MSDTNYFDDHRVRAGEGRWYNTLNESKMTATITVWEDENTEVAETVPFTFEVCPTCDGKGTHVNPSIDCDGLSREDFDADPDFAEEYMAGRYDQQCNGCGGRRVVPVMNEDRVKPELLKQIKAEQRADAEYRSICRAERAMGC